MKKKSVKLSPRYDSNNRVKKNDGHRKNCKINTLRSRFFLVYERLAELEILVADIKSEFPTILIKMCKLT